MIEPLQHCLARSQKDTSPSTYVSVSITRINDPSRANLLSSSYTNFVVLPFWLRSLRPSIHQGGLTLNC
jgi:hypothetical protein